MKPSKTQSMFFHPTPTAFDRAVAASSDAAGFQPEEGGSQPTLPLQSFQRDLRLTVDREGMTAKTWRWSSLATVYGYHFGRIPSAVAQTFIESYEWLGYLGRGRICYGLWEDGRLLGVDVFAPLPLFAERALEPAFQRRTLMLTRGACALNAGPHAASALIGAALRDLRKRDMGLVVAYSDPAAGERGVIYRAANAAYLGKTESVIRYVCIDGRWYSPKGLYNIYGKSPPPCERERVDRSVRLRWGWLLDKSLGWPKSLLPRKVPLGLVG